MFVLSLIYISKTYSGIGYLRYKQFNVNSSGKLEYSKARTYVLLQYLRHECYKLIDSV